jgi:flagellar protein FlaF
MAQGAYAAAATELSSPQTTEYDAFARVTRALKIAESAPARIAALHDNRRLWTVLAAGVADEDNALPEALRARIFALAEFVRLHSSKVLRDEAGIDVLIDINTAIMRGLRQQTRAAR